MEPGTGCEREMSTLPQLYMRQGYSLRQFIISLNNARSQPQWLAVSIGQDHRQTSKPRPIENEKMCKLFQVRYQFVYGQDR